MLGGRFSTLVFSIQETDLEIGYTPAGKVEEILQAARKMVVSLRNQILLYPDRRFLESFIPLEGESDKPLLQHMLAAARKANVGPMASVAGAIAQEVGKGLKQAFALDEIVVENGGDLYIDIQETITVTVVAPGNPLDGKLAFRIPPSVCPIGVATSSGKTGPSVSLGKADAVMVACHDAALSDAFATAFCNCVQKPDDLPLVAKMAKREDTVLGFLGLCEDRLALGGSLEVERI